MLILARKRSRSQPGIDDAVDPAYFNPDSSDGDDDNDGDNDDDDDGGGSGDDNDDDDDDDDALVNSLEIDVIPNVNDEAPNDVACDNTGTSVKLPCDFLLFKT